MTSETITKCLAGSLSTMATVKNQLIGYGYDVAGNLTQEGSGSPSWSYTYDAENRISAIAGSASETFKYDGDGERVYKSYGAIFWRLPGGPFLTKASLSGTIGSEHIYFGGRHVAILSGTTPYYLFPDHLGGEHIVTNASGTICNDIDTLPFGGEIDYTKSCGPSYLFAGMDRGNENSSDLDYDINRYYDLRVGRFMTPDWAAVKPSAVPFAEWADPQSLNLYSFVRNNPLAKADPDGHDPGDEFKTKAAAAVDAVKYMRQQDGGYKVEYGTRIHQDGKSFSYGPVVTQENPKAVDPPALQKSDVGDVHTHNYGVGEDSHANNVEQPDRTSAINAKHDVQQMQDSAGTKVDYQSYIGAPNGDVIQFTPNSNAPDLLGDAKVVQKPRLQRGPQLNLELIAMSIRPQ